MKKYIIILSLVAFILAILVSTSLALRYGENVVQIPKGTKMEKIGDKTRFLLADGVFEVIGIKGELLVKAYDKKGKLLYSGKQGKIFSGEAKTPTSIRSIREKAVMDDVLYIRFNPEPAAR
jgi:hypothetical protein